MGFLMFDHNLSSIPLHSNALRTRGKYISTKTNNNQLYNVTTECTVTFNRSDTNTSEMVTDICHIMIKAEQLCS